MKKIMVLGASYTQTPLYQKAAELGIATVAASIPGDYPGFRLADEFVHVDISDPAAVADAAEALQVDAVVTCGLDLGMRAIGAANDRLHLKGPTEAAALRAGNKYFMKEALVKAGVQTAPFFRISTEEELQRALDRLTFPVILKAVDLMGSRGIYRSNDREEAVRCFRQTMSETRQDYCLVEEFIEGELFGTEGMIQNGRILFLLPNNTESFQAAVPTPIGHSIPYAYEASLGEQIRTQVSKAVAALGLDDCPFNCDLIRRGDQVYLVELTGRNGATGLAELVGAHYGISYYECILKVALGKDLTSRFQHVVRNAVLALTLRAEREGSLRKIRLNKALLPDDIDLSFNIEPGDHVQPYTNGRDRIGQVILSGRTPEECRRKLRLTEQAIWLELEGDLPVCRTPIQHLNSFSEENQIFMKREDLLPFSFGGNKVRFAEKYLADLTISGCDAMIIYGGYHSNLCRILAAACKGRNIPCSMIYNVEDKEDVGGANADLVRRMGVRPYPCRSGEIAQVVQQTMDDLTSQGRKPYYIHGNKFGQGRVSIPMDSYVEVYGEILEQEREAGLHFDYIFLASSTNTTQSGLTAAHLIRGDDRHIVGISVSRRAGRALEVIRGNLKEYQERRGVAYRLCAAPEILLEDKYLAGGYGLADEKIRSLIRDLYEKEGIAMDQTYTGKAFRGMMDYLAEHRIKGKNILFLHTGGTPLFFDEL